MQAVHDNGDVVLVWPAGDRPPYTAFFLGYLTNGRGKLRCLVDTPGRQISIDPHLVTEFESVRTSRLPISIMNVVGHA